MFAEFMCIYMCMYRRIYIHIYSAKVDCMYREHVYVCRVYVYIYVYLQIYIYTSIQCKVDIPKSQPAAQFTRESEYLS